MSNPPDTENAFVIASGGQFDKKTADKAIAKAKPPDSSELETQVDVTRVTQYSQGSLYASLSVKGNAPVVDSVKRQIIKYFQTKKGSNGSTIFEHTIYYTGHGTKAGDWCFYDGTISFEWIYETFKKYGPLFYHTGGRCIAELKKVHVRKLTIFSDCCYSGKWVDKAYMKQFHDDGVCLTVVAASGSNQKAYDNQFSKTYDPYRWAQIMNGYGAKQLKGDCFGFSKITKFVPYDHKYLCQQARRD